MNEVEVKRYKEWHKKHSKPYEKHYTTSFIFTPTGIGTAVEVECACGPGSRRNITDYDSW